jgi:hypothetical protein
MLSFTRSSHSSHPIIQSIRDKVPEIVQHTHSMSLMKCLSVGNNQQLCCAICELMSGCGKMSKLDSLLSRSIDAWDCT